MIEPLLTYLDGHRLYNPIEINDFLSGTEPYCSMPLDRVAKRLTELSVAGAIDISGTEYMLLGDRFITPDLPLHNNDKPFYTLDNVKVEAFITDAGRSHLRRQERDFYDLVNAQRLYYDYKKVRRIASWGLIIAVLTLILSLWTAYRQEP
jgi:hypothetical protein